MNSIQQKVMEIIENITHIDITPIEITTVNYLEKGLFDSFQIVEIITSLEEYFKIKFSVDDLTSQKFQTLEGIIEIIQSQINKK